MKSCLTSLETRGMQVKITRFLQDTTAEVAKQLETANTTVSFSPLTGENVEAPEDLHIASGQQKWFREPRKQFV